MLAFGASGVATDIALPPNRPGFAPISTDILLSGIERRIFAWYMDGYVVLLKIPPSVLLEDQLALNAARAFTLKFPITLDSPDMSGRKEIPCLRK